MEFFQLAATYKLSSAWVFLVTVDILLGVTKCASQEEVQQHLSIGGELMARGQLQDALPHFHAAVEADPKNYMCYFKRGTVHLALGKAKNAVNDFNKVLELKPGFTGARNYRAMVLMKQGLLDHAKEDYLYIYQQENNGEAYGNYVKAQNLQSDIALAEAQMKNNDFVSAVEHLTLLIESCPWSSYLRELRSQCYVALDNPQAAILDLKSTTKLTPDNTDGLFKLAILYYQLGQAQESLKESRACLKLDPDHKDCFPHYKKVKKIDKFLSDAQSSLDSEQYDNCINNLQKVLKTEEKVPMIRFVTNAKLGTCYLKNNQASESVDACTKALEISKDPEVLCDRAEAYIALDMFEKAMKDYHEVLDGHEGYPRAKEGIQRAQKLQKQSEKRDYYKILGVKRSATKKEITKAYRKAAQQWHPDNFPDGNEKKKAEKKFIDIAAAKEVLTNDEKRAKFDEGDDPLDPESGNHEGFNPFQQYHMFHGQPFTVRFNFH